MASTTSKVLAGCGIGCVVVIVIAAGVSFMGYRWVKDTTEAVDEAGRVERELEEQFGPVRAYVPPAGPGVPADRMEVFLAVREALTERRDELAAAVTGLASEGEGGGVVSGLRRARAGVSLAPATLGFASARNRALLDAKMGVGEYTWIYWFSYDAWLGHPAGDSELHEIMNRPTSGHGSVQMHFDGGMEPEQITWRLRRDITAMLKNLETELAADPDRVDLLQAVTAELAELEADPGRVPWQTGLPEVFAAGMEPYRDRLEATYSRATNPFELIELH
jgi:hypothetical protein